MRGVLPARLRKLGFLLDQEAADGGSADVERACNLGFADALPVEFPGFDSFVNHRGRSAEAFPVQPCMGQAGADTFA